MSGPSAVDQLGDKLKAFGGNWTTFTLLGSFLLYVLGYLALRFHLTALGLGTDLAVLDERYLFTGARFLVYVVSTVPSVVLLALIVAAVLYLPYRTLPATLRQRTKGRVRDLAARWGTPRRLAVLGVGFAVVMVQFFMRDCFELSNLLLRPSLPASSMLGGWLLREDEGRIALFFTGLVAGCLVSGAILLAVAGRLEVPRWLAGLLGFLVAVQCLLVAVNYGYLVLDKSLPRVATLDGKEPLAAHREAWLVWEGKDGMTYLVRDTGTPPRKALITLGRSKVEKVEIIAYDRILPALFGPGGERP